MNLHRIDGMPDWEKRTQAQHNIFQKVAARTGGVISPGNAVTLLGLLVVSYGLVLLTHGHLGVGLLFIAAGRMLDVVDGAVADITGTKSPLGELFDVVVDKLETLLVVIVLIIMSHLYWLLIAALIVPQVLIPLVTFYKNQRGISLHPSLTGKLSMAGTWFGLVGILGLQVFGPSLPLVTAVYVITGLTLVLGIYTCWLYTGERVS